jgi:hypothetical protein
MLHGAENPRMEFLRAIGENVGFRSVREINPVSKFSSGV